MVAPYDIGDPIRSFVRVTGTGTDKKTKPICWDLARGSTAAGAAPVPQNLPRATPIATLLKLGGSGQENGAQEDEHPAEGVPAQPQNGVRIQMPSGAESPEPGEQRATQETGARKRRRNVESGSLESTASDVAEPPQKSIRVAGGGVQGGSGAGTSSDTSVAADAKSELVPPGVKKIVIKVLQECTRLRKENGELQQENAELKAEKDKQQIQIDELREKHDQLEERVALFHDLFKDKRRLCEFLKALGVSAQLPTSSPRAEQQQQGPTQPA